MGLTASSTGIHAQDNGLIIHKTSDDELVVALAGNPNVGKSTVFNELTGLHQHTGNWPGKTVSNAQGTYRHKGIDHILVDIPGAYSLLALSAEEEVARDFICFGGADATIIVCDATCLERNLNLVLQTIEITPNAVVCINLLDEAKRKKINVNIPLLEEKLGIPVVGTSARSGKGLDKLVDAVDKAAKETPVPYCVRYALEIENAINLLEMPLANLLDGKLNERWVALKLLEGDEKLLASIDSYLSFSLLQQDGIKEAQDRAKQLLDDAGYDSTAFRDSLVSSVYHAAERLCSDVVTVKNENYNEFQLKVDKILTRKSTGIPIMLALLALVFYITIAGANIPSQILSDFFFYVEDLLTNWFHSVGAPDWLHGALILGVYRVLTWVIAVMLPPMAIFFPLFTLLEDLGYLPRVAFNLDNTFRRCCACGKQSLTMCMGFGCNAAGVIGCRIIESPRERLIATITNSFVPCNGRFPQPHKRQEWARRGAG